MRWWWWSSSEAIFNETEGLWPENAMRLRNKEFIIYYLLFIIYYLLFIAFLPHHKIATHKQSSDAWRQSGAARHRGTQPPPFGRKAMGLFGTKGGKCKCSWPALQMIHRLTLHVLGHSPLTQWHQGGGNRHREARRWMEMRNVLFVMKMKS